MLKENKLLLATAPLCCHQVSSLPRCSGFPTGSDPSPGTELARRAPAQGHAPVRGIHEMQTAQQGDAKQGLPVGVPGGGEGPGSGFPQWQWMLLSPSPSAPGSFLFCRKQAGTKKFQLSTPSVCAFSLQAKILLLPENPDAD